LSLTFDEGDEEEEEVVEQPENACKKKTKLIMESSTYTGITTAMNVFSLI
jgi:hypothetical protein